MASALRSPEAWVPLKSKTTYWVPISQLGTLGIVA